MMTLKYYLRHCLWGWCGYGYLIYFIVRDMNDGLIFPAYAICHLWLHILF